MATCRRRPVQCAVYRLWRERTACCVALFVLCACVRGVSGQRLYEVEPQSAVNPEPRGRNAGGAASPGVSGRLQNANAPITNRFGNTRDGQGTSETEQAQIGPNYDPNNKRFGGTNRNPYRAGSGGYRGRFSNTNFGYEKYDPNRKVEGIGILAGWRPDLQGARRPESVFLNPYNNLQVQTRLGPVTGFRVQLYDRPGLPEELWPVNLQPELQKHKLNVSVFLGIPYAQPPVDEGRFKPPRAHPGWQTWMALDFRPACPQPERFVGESRGVREMHEDCLYLNVFSPSLSSNVNEKYAVMVYIHGGEFSHGASNLFPAHMLAAHGEVVVVTFNYRLGALGFLSTGDEYSPGNYGMLDQAMAVRWVHENIHYFNGDRSKITVFGPGAGAASAGLLAVAPRTAHMVHQVIAESGSPLAEWAAIYDVWRVQNTSRIFGDKIGCNSDTSFKLLNCLSKGRSAIEIGNVEFKPEVGTFPWAPYIETNTTFPGNDWYEEWRQDDWRFLPDFPEKLYRQRKFNPKLRVLAGANRDEAAFFVYQNRSLAPDFTITQRILDERICEWVKQYNYTLNPDGVYEAIRYMYTYWPDRYNRTWIRQMYVDFLGDALYKAPVDSLVKLAVELDVPTYQYVLNTSVEALKAPFWREIPHDVQYYFLTGGPFMDPEFFPQDERIARELWTELDRNMSQLFIETFSNFAKYGRPTPRQIFNLVNWQPALHGDLRYLSINNTFNSTMWSNYRQTECAFWSQYLPTVVGHLVPTYRPSTEFWWEPKEPLQIAFWSVTSLAFLLMVIVGICCCLWQGAKKKNERLYEASFMDDAFDVRENNHFASKPSKQPSVASLGGGGLGPGSDGMRGDARSVQQQIQQDRRRRSDAARHLGSADELRAGGGAESSATELEPLQPEQFLREPSRASARSRDTVQYATLEHHGRLTAPKERDTEAVPARQTPQQTPQQTQQLPQQQAQRPQQQLPQRTQQLPQQQAQRPQQRPQQQLPQQPQQQAQQPPHQQQPPSRPDPRRLGGVSVLPTANTQAAVAHAKSIPNMVEMEPQRPTAQARARARSVEALDQDAQSNSSRPGTPKVPHFQFVEPYDVVQLPDDYQYNSNPNLAGIPQRPPSRSEPAQRLQQPAGYVPPETRPVAPPGRPTAAPRAAPVPAVPTSAPPPRPGLQHQAQIVVQMASRPQSRGDAITPAPPRQNGSAAVPAPLPSAGTPPPAYSRRTAPQQSGAPDQDSKRVSGALQENARAAAAGGWRAGADTPSTSAGYPTAASERSIPDTPSVSTDRSYDSAELEYRQQPRRYVPPETAL